jgi:hypothetical protein
MWTGNNSFHHTSPTIDGHDDTSTWGSSGAFTAPEAPRIPPRAGLYLVDAVRFLRDQVGILWTTSIRSPVGRIGHRIPPAAGKDLLIFIAGKIAFFSMALGNPYVLHPWWAVLSHVRAGCICQRRCAEQSCFSWPIA